MQNRCLIANEWVGPADGVTIAVSNPATDALVARVPLLGDAETRRAIGAAHDAWPSWRSTPASERAALVKQLSDLMRRDADRLAALMTAEQGKPLAESRGEIEYGASFLDVAAAEATRDRSEILPSPPTGKRLRVIRQPVGVAAIITPWNFPNAMITRKLGPALGTGCTVVIKPARQTPLSAIALGELSLEAGFPAGVINIVSGDARAIGGALLDDDRVRKLSFTGSTEIGRLLMAGAAENVLRLSLELGGHAPFIVFDDANVERAVAGAIACKFRNAGQTCICANRFLVQAGVYDEFVGRFAEAIDGLVVGDGARDGVHIGPLIDDDAIAKVEAHVQDACERGGTIRCGGRRVRLDGLADRFYEPTLIEGMTAGMHLWREETFGPVAPVARFETEDEAIGLANDSEYGLAAYFFTRDASRVTRVAAALEAGIIGANDGAPSNASAPFGGVKHSGIGREGGRYAMDEYTEVKYVSEGL